MGTTPITPVRIPLDLRKQLDALAQLENRTVSNVVVTLLQEALAMRKRARK